MIVFGWREETTHQLNLNIQFAMRCEAHNLIIIYAVQLEFIHIFDYALWDFQVHQRNLNLEPCKQQ